MNRLFQTPTDNRKLRDESNRIQELIKGFTESLNTKRRIHTLLVQKGVRAQWLFWNLINRKPKKKNSFEALETPNGLSSDQDMNMVIENFFKIKFNTSFDWKDVIREKIDEARIGIPTTQFTQQTSDKMRGLTIEEHKWSECHQSRGSRWGDEQYDPAFRPRCKKASPNLVQQCDCWRVNSSKLGGRSCCFSTEEAAADWCKQLSANNED